MNGANVRWGVLSTAAIAIEHVIPAIGKAAGCEVVAIASRTTERAEAVAAGLGIPRAYGSYAELLSDPQVDCVYIGLPNSMHVEWAVRAAEAGKAVLCDKPMALNAGETGRIVDAARAQGVLLTEGFMYRYHQQFRWLRGLLDDGVVGQVRTIRGAIGFVIGPPPNIRLDPELGGGALLDVGCYPLDAMCLLFGAAPTAARAVAFHDGGVDHTCAAVLTFPGERLGVMDGTFRLPWLQAPLEVAGDDAVVRLEDAFNPGQKPCRATVLRAGKPVETIDFPGMDMFQAMVESFSESYRTGRPLDYDMIPSLHTAAASDLVRAAFREAGHV
ncbi:oxidoreductase [Rhizocola hellebori]|uniref:Oxidoreductase n=1 Tax=Rhizocola hellebori TaxID=1392758 RepID=A0A8J3QC15_9ACTN|nr:Gfo/Idh/MocA family oxidoreductase [Rhizocola hellebori]GIH07816.1 oxidoreductase [Rhizocola hellebori]